MRLLILMTVALATACTFAPLRDSRSDDGCVVVPRPQAGPRAFLTIEDLDDGEQSYKLETYDLVDELWIGADSAEIKLESDAKYDFELLESGDKVTVTVKKGDCIMTLRLVGTPHDRDSPRPMPVVHPERTQDVVEFDFKQYRYSLTFIVRD